MTGKIVRYRASAECFARLSQTVPIKLVAHCWQVSPDAVRYWIAEDYIAAAAPYETGFRDWIIDYQSVIDFRGQPIKKFTA